MLSIGCISYNKQPTVVKLLFPGIVQTDKLEITITEPYKAFATDGEFSKINRPEISDYPM